MSSFRGLGKQDVGGRDEPGHDSGEVVQYDRKRAVVQMRGFRMMTRISIPTARKNGALGALRGAWTAPTPRIGHTAPRLLGSSRPQRVGDESTSARPCCPPTG